MEVKKCINPSCQNQVKSKRSVFCSHSCYTDYEKEYFARMREEKIGIQKV